MQFLYWLRAQRWVLIALPILLFLGVAGYLTDRELKTRAFVAEAQRVMREMEAQPVVMNVKVKYAFKSETVNIRGHTCRIIDGWFTFIALEDPKGFAHLSPAITDWTVCTPLNEVVDTPLWDFHHPIPPVTQPEPHTFNNPVDFRDFVRP